MTSSVTEACQNNKISLILILGLLNVECHFCVNELFCSNIFLCCRLGLYIVILLIFQYGKCEHIFAS